MLEPYWTGSIPDDSSQSSGSGWAESEITDDEDLLSPLFEDGGSGSGEGLDHNIEFSHPPPTTSTPTRTITTSHGGFSSYRVPQSMYILPLVSLILCFIQM